MQLDHLFTNSQNLPSIPEVVRTLLKSFNDDRADLTAIAKSIALDQTLSAKVLRLANSARYGQSRKIASIDDAVLIMGFGALRTLVVASGLTGAFRAPPSMDMKMFWRASLATAGYAAWLAKSAGYREDIAFTGGMMLHVGVLLLHMEEPEKTQAIDKAVAIGGFRPELETPVFGFHHVDVSAELATRWNFPPEIIGGMRSYTDPLSQASSEPYGAIYRIADFLAEALLRETSEEQISAEFPKDLALALDLNLEPLLSSIPPLKTILEGLEELIG